MNDALKMQISAFVDGELPDNESELLLRRLSQDADLRQLVAHYLDIGRHVRREPEIPNMAQLRGRIAEALGEESHIVAVETAPAGNRMAKPLAGIAVAASVALLAIIALQQAGGPDPSATQPVADTEGYTEPAADQMLDEMFRIHESTSDGVGSNGILPALATWNELSESDLDESQLVRVEPRAELVSPIEISSEVDEEEVDIADAEQQAD